MELSINTDYFFDVGCPENNLRKIAETGFTHIHWVHHWHTDFLYSDWEIDRIGAWLKAYGLKLQDLHGSSGIEKNWRSLREYERKAGVELVKNRMDMTARLGGDTVVMHITGWMADEKEDSRQDEQLIKSLDELAPFAKSRDIKIAVENLVPPRVDLFSRLFDRYPPEFLSFCYDSGHRNISLEGPNPLALFKDRLAAVHLHDNDGSGDQHRLIFDGNVPWDEVAGLMADSAYAKCLTMELSWDRERYPDESEFLSKAYETGARLTKMVEERRSPVKNP